MVLCLIKAMKDVVRENFILNSMPHHGSTIIPQMVDQLKEAFIHMDNRGKLEARQ